SSLTPQVVLSGSTDFTLTVNGSDFTADASVLWNGSALPSKFVSSGQMTATVSAALTATAGKASVTVSAQGVASNAAEVTIAALMINSVNPNTVSAGSSDVTLTVNGGGFTSGAVARWNGTALTTKVVSLNQVTATVPAESVGSAGVASVTVAV